MYHASNYDALFEKISSQVRVRVHISIWALQTSASNVRALLFCDCSNGGGYKLDTFITFPTYVVFSDK